MLQHLKGYQKSITFIKTGRLKNINTSEIRTETGGETNINMCNLRDASINRNYFNMSSKADK